MPIDMKPEIDNWSNFKDNSFSCALLQENLESINKAHNDSLNLQSNYPNEIISIHQGYTANNSLIGKEVESDFLHLFMTNPDFIKDTGILDCKTDSDQPFYICDLGQLFNKYRQWKSQLPVVTPFYAIKSNPNKMVCKTLEFLGANFDCASKEEIRQILALGVNPDRIIYANPCKTEEYIKYAYEQGVNCMTFDNEDELYKVKANHPNAKMVIRIRVDDSNSACQFGVKFGVYKSSTYGLLEKAKSLGVDVIGVSFHVGSGCGDPKSYIEALSSCKDVFNEAEELGFNFRLLDIGGGFPGYDETDKIGFESFAESINFGINKYFRGMNINIIAEPGRYFCSSIFTLATQVTSRRVTYSDNNKSFMYYINDGIYGSFNCIIFDHWNVPIPSFGILDESSKSYQYNDKAELLYESSIWGPTCDSIDVLTKSIKFPELKIGDRLVFKNMGAYTLAPSTSFNGFNPAKVYYLYSSIIFDNKEQQRKYLERMNQEE